MKIDVQPEEWRPVKGSEFHEVSNLGRVRTKDHYFLKSTGRVFRPGRILTPYAGKQGHVMVNIHGAKCSRCGVRLIGRKFVARISHEGKTKHLGRFDSANEAHEVYLEHSKKQFGEFSSPCIHDRLHAKV